MEMEQTHHRQWHQEVAETENYIAVGAFCSSVAIFVVVDVKNEGKE